MSDILGRLALGISASAALSIVVKATIVLLLALGAVRLLRRSRAATRHLVLAAAFGALLMLPILADLMPPAEVPIRAAHVAAFTSPAPDHNLEIAGGVGVEPVSNASDPIPRRHPSLPLTTLLRIGWVAGALIVLIPLGAASWRLRRIRRSASPWHEGEALVDTLAAAAGIRRTLDVLLHDDIVVPMTSGLVRPMIVMPADAREWSGADIRQAILHELEHVRRADWPMELTARLLCALYWFHPLVWTARRRLRLESERACDDAVLGGAERTDYAEQLVRLAERLSADTRRAALSMASRSDLSTRVAAVLNDRQARGRAGAFRVGMTAAAAVVFLVAVSPLRAVERSAASDVRLAADQTSAPATRGVSSAFDVASVKRNTTGDSGLGNDPHARTSTQAGGICSPFGWDLPSETCFRATNITLRELIVYAFSRHDLFGGPPGPQIFGGPTWIDSDRFDIVARAEGNAPMEPFASRELTMMVGTLLAERFRLALHHENRALPIYALRPARSDGRTGPKLRPATADCIAKNGALLTGNGPSMSRDDPCRQGYLSANGYLKSSAMDMSQLALVLSNRSNRVVRDETEIAGMFVIDLTWPPDRPALFVAALEEQLGLKLEAATGPVDVLTIDHAERPQEN